MRGAEPWAGTLRLSIISLLRDDRAWSAGIAICRSFECHGQEQMLGSSLVPSIMASIKTKSPPEPGATSRGSRRFLPRIGSPGYHLLLGTVAIFILGPLGGISAAFMNFSIGFFLGGQVLGGILGSPVTLPYGPEGKHGANYMQTMAASVAGMSAMAPLVQAMVWLGLPVPPAWQLVVYFLCLGMFGVGIGMLYTPILDRK